MPNETPPQPLTEADFDSIEGAVMETARGRWFLAEYARRIRADGTDRILASIAQLESAVHFRPPPQNPIIEAEIGAFRDMSALMADRLQTLIGRLGEQGAAPDICSSLRQVAETLAGIPGSKAVAALGPPEPADRWRDEAPPPIVPDPPAPLPATERGVDPRLAALARLDALSLAEKCDLFV